MPYTPIDAARQANVSVGSIRNWTREYGDLLSPEARGENGPRLLDDNDLRILSTIAGLRKSGIPPAQIRERITSTDVPPIIDLEATEPTPQAPPQSPTEAHNGILAPALVQSTFAAIQARIDTLERRIEAQAQDSRTRSGMFAVGVIVGILLVLLLFIAANQLLGA